MIHNKIYKPCVSVECLFFVESIVHIGYTVDACPKLYLCEDVNIDAKTLLWIPWIPWISSTLHRHLTIYNIRIISHLDIIPILHYWPFS